MMLLVCGDVSVAFFEAHLTLPGNGLERVSVAGVGTLELALAPMLTSTRPLPNWTSTS